MYWNNPAATLLLFPFGLCPRLFGGNNVQCRTQYVRETLVSRATVSAACWMTGSPPFRAGLLYSLLPLFLGLERHYGVAPRSNDQVPP